MLESDMTKPVLEELAERKLLAAAFRIIRTRQSLKTAKLTELVSALDLLGRERPEDHFLIGVPRICSVPETKWL